VKHNYLLFIILFSIVWKANAQDIHFSQYFHSPLTVSPSNTGNFDGDWRVTSNYRSQWRQIDQPFLTQSFGYDQQVYLHSERLSAGGIIINDKSGGNLNVFKLQLSLAYHKQINKHNLHGGIQGGFSSKRIAPPGETFPNQFNWGTGRFDNALPNSEAMLQESMFYGDFNAGFGYHLKLKKLMPHISLALFHLNRPRETFFENGDRLQTRKVINGGVKVKVNEKVTLDPSFLIMTTTGVNSMVAGSNIIYTLESNQFNNTSVFGGVFYRDGFGRNVDAYFLTTGLIYKNYTFGLSYDRNISSLHTATNYRGAFEVSFIYTALNTRLKKVQIPCDRY
jgi:type IX secretion system PorP/SprF family membrane protein